MTIRLCMLALAVAGAISLSPTQAEAQSCSGQPSANTVCAGPTSGGGGLPGFRAMVPADVATAGAPSVPRLWQPLGSNCDSGHSLWWIDENFCATWGQSFVTNDDPSVLVAIPVGGVAGPTGATQTLTFTFGSGACVSGCAASYTFQAFSMTAQITGTNLVVTSLPGGATIQIGQTITGTGVAGGTKVTGPQPGTTWTGGVGTYTVNNSSTSSGALTATDTLNSIAWGLSNAIKSNANLYNPTAANTSQQRQIIWSTANTAAPQISLDIDGRNALKIVATSSGGSTVTSVPPGCSVACPLNLDVGPFIQYTRAPGFVPLAGSNIFQAFYGSQASGGSGIYGQFTVNIVDPALSVGQVFISGTWNSSIPAGVYVSKGLYSLNNTDHGVDTAAFNSFIGTTFVGNTFSCAGVLLGTTPTDCYIAANGSPAAAGAQQFSPDIRLSGNGWKTNATAGSEQVDWRLVNEPVQGTADPSSNLTFNFQVNGGGYTQQFRMTSGGIFSANTGFQINGAAAGGQFLRGNGTAFIGATPAFTDISGIAAVTQGGTGVGTLTSNGVLYGNGTGNLQVTAQGSNRSVLVGNAGAPSFSATPNITQIIFDNGVGNGIAIRGPGGNPDLKLVEGAGNGFFVAPNDSAAVCFPTCSVGITDNALNFIFAGTNGSATPTAANNIFHVYPTTDATNSTTAGSIFDGGIAVAKSIISGGSLYSSNATFLARSKTTLTNNAAAAAATLANAPAAGNPTKWIGIDDNGTTRFIPAW